jgi:alpha-glucoside transport system substrate-binding protein
VRRTGVRRSRWAVGAVLAMLAPALAVAAGCTADGDDSALDGESLEVVAVWEGSEADAFRAVLRLFEQRTGARVEFTSTGGDVGAALDERIAAGDPPDVAVLPQPGLLERYARSGAIRPLGADVADLVRDRYSDRWQELATVDGDLYGVWFKAANKSLIWYSIGAFERAGVVPPADLERLEDVAATLADAGTPPFAVAAAPEDAWVLTDWFENIYLRVAGPERYDDLADHRLAWTDDSVRRALEQLARYVAPGYVAGGRRAALTTELPEAAAQVFSPEPGAAMVLEGDFVPGVVAPGTGGELGVDVDVVPFPEEGSTERFVVGGGDVAVAMRRSEAADALLRFLAGPGAGEVWAAQGGFLSPNEEVDLAAYPDDATRRIARSLLEAGDGFRFDLSDLQPVEFGGTTGAGMWAELRRFVADPGDVSGTMVRLEAAATAARNPP